MKRSRFVRAERIPNSFLDVVYRPRKMSNNTAGGSEGYRVLRFRFSSTCNDIKIHTITTVFPTCLIKKDEIPLLLNPPSPPPETLFGVHQNLWLLQILPRGPGCFNEPVVVCCRISRANAAVRRNILRVPSGENRIYHRVRFVCRNVPAQADFPIERRR